MSQSGPCICKKDFLYLPEKLQKRKEIGANFSIFGVLWLKI